MKPSFEIQNLTKSCNELLILSTVLDEKKHGYQIALEIEEKSAGYFKFNHGTLYPILHKMEKEKYIKGSWQQEGPKRKRKYYTITEKGKKYYAAQNLGWHDFFQQFMKLCGEKSA
ncbi:MAG TPA: helix-turn-helix transcriptional regulator [bacterium]|nr:helix-turn-helix transcriptional regulator [bacterium]HPN46152.1 helix-turn-helix transcriptional regulator [bacterium]